MRFVLMLLIVIAVPVAGFSQTTWYVDDDAPDDPGPDDPDESDPLEDGSSDHPFDCVQEALAAAANGDTVLVAPGVYTDNVDFLGKAVTVRSEDPETLDVAPESTILSPGSGTVVTFQSGEGPGSVLEGFKIIGGFAFFSTGGGINCTAASPTLRGNIIDQNMSVGSGGGILCRDGAAPVILRNRISNNSSLLSGGGICCLDCSPLIEGNTIYQNSALISGGGIYCTGASSPVISNNLIYWNATDTRDGTHGGGIYCGEGTAPIIINNTVSQNTARYRGGGIYCASAGPEIINTIVWKNEAEALSEIGGSPAVTYSVVQGGFPGEGNLGANPLFLSPKKGNFRISFTSPCRDSGDSASPHLPDEDFEGDPRVTNGQVDIGADELVSGPSETSTQRRFKWKADKRFNERSAGDGTAEIALDGTFEFIDSQGWILEGTFRTRNRRNTRLAYSITPAGEATLRSGMIAWLETEAAGEGITLENVEILLRKLSFVTVKVDEDTGMPQRIRFKARGTISADLDGGRVSKKFSFRENIDFIRAVE